MAIDIETLDLSTLPSRRRREEEEGVFEDIDLSTLPPREVQEFEGIDLSTLPPRDTGDLETGLGAKAEDWIDKIQGITVEPKIKEPTPLRKGITGIQSVRREIESSVKFGALRTFASEKSIEDSAISADTLGWADVLREISPEFKPGGSAAGDPARQFVEVEIPALILGVATDPLAWIEMFVVGKAIGWSIPKLSAALVRRFPKLGERIKTLDFIDDLTKGKSPEPKNDLEAQITLKLEESRGEYFRTRVGPILRRGFKDMGLTDAQAGRTLGWIETNRPSGGELAGALRWMARGNAKKLQQSVSKSIAEGKPVPPQDVSRMLAWGTRAAATEAEIGTTLQLATNAMGFLTENIRQRAAEVLSKAASSQAEKVKTLQREVRPGLGLTKEDRARIAGALERSLKEQLEVEEAASEVERVRLREIQVAGRAQVQERVRVMAEQRAGAERRAQEARRQSAAASREVTRLSRQFQEAEDPDIAAQVERELAESREDRERFSEMQEAFEEDERRLSTRDITGPRPLLSALIRDNVKLSAKEVRFVTGMDRKEFPPALQRLIVGERSKEKTVPLDEIAEGVFTPGGEYSEFGIRHAEKVEREDFQTGFLDALIEEAETPTGRAAPITRRPRAPRKPEKIVGKPPVSEATKAAAVKKEQQVDYFDKQERQRAGTLERVIKKGEKKGWSVIRTAEGRRITLPPTKVKKGLLTDESGRLSADPIAASTGRLGQIIGVATREALGSVEAVLHTFGGAHGKDLAYRMAEQEFNSGVIAADLNESKRQIDKLIASRQRREFLSGAIDPFFAPQGDAAFEKFKTLPEVRKAVEVFRKAEDKIFAKAAALKVMISVRKTRYAVVTEDGRTIRAFDTEEAASEALSKSKKGVEVIPRPGRDIKEPIDRHYIRQHLLHMIRPEALEGNSGERMIQHLLDTGQAANESDANKILHELRQYGTTTAQGGGLQYARRITLPVEAYESEFDKIFFSMTRRASSFLSYVEWFGQRNEKIKSLLGGLDAQDPTIGKFARTAIERIAMGGKETPTAGSELFGLLARGSVKAIMTLPIRGFKNLLMGDLNDFGPYGMYRFVTGYLSILSPETRRLARASGAISAGGVVIRRTGLGKVTGIVSLMAPSEWMNRVKAVGRSVGIAQDSLAVLRGRSVPTMRWALTEGFLRPKTQATHFLEQVMRFTPEQVEAQVERGYFTESELEHIAYFGSSETQGAVSVRTMPLWVSSRYGAPAAMLQKMAFRSAQNLWNNMAKPLGQGNVGQLLRWAIAAPALGAAYLAISHAMYGVDDKNKYKTLASRLWTYALRGEILGVFSNTFDEFGTLQDRYQPGMIQHVGEIWKHASWALTGKEAPIEAADQTMRRVIALYNATVKNYDRIMHPDRVENFKVRRILINIGREQGWVPERGDFEPTERSPYYKDVKKAFWISDKKEQGRAYWSAVNAISISMPARDQRDLAKNKRKAIQAVNTSVRSTRPVPWTDSLKLRVIHSTLDSTDRGRMRKAQFKWQKRHKDFMETVRRFKTAGLPISESGI